MVTANLSDPGGQFVWMSKVLQKARLSGEKVRNLHDLIKFVNATSL